MRKCVFGGFRPGLRQPGLFTTKDRIKFGTLSRVLGSWVAGPFCLFVFVLRLNVPVNNFSVMSGQSQRFLSLTSTVGSLCVQGHIAVTPVGIVPRTSRFGVQLYHYATALPGAILFSGSLGKLENNRGELEITRREHSWF